MFGSPGLVASSFPDRAFSIKDLTKAARAIGRARRDGPEERQSTASDEDGKEAQGAREARLHPQSREYHVADSLGPFPLVNCQVRAH